MTIPPQPHSFTRPGTAVPGTVIVQAVQALGLKYWLLRACISADQEANDAMTMEAYPCETEDAALTLWRQLANDPEAYEDCISDGLAHNQAFAIVRGTLMPLVLQAPAPPMTLSGVSRPEQLVPQFYELSFGNSEPLKRQIEAVAEAARLAAADDVGEQDEDAD